MSEDIWDEIRAAHDKAEWASLLELCGLHLKRVPDHLDTRIPQAIALRHLNRFEEAVALLQETYDHESASPKCKYHCQCELGLTFEQVGKFDDARNAYQSAHQLFPHKDRTYNLSRCDGASPRRFCRGTRLALPCA